MVEELPAKQLVGYTGLQVQVLCAALIIIISACAATGRQAGLRSQRPKAIVGSIPIMSTFTNLSISTQNLMQS